MPDRTLEEKLREQRDRFISFAFAGADLLIELDGSFAVTFSAGATDGAYGFSDSQAMGQPLSDIVAAKDRRALNDALHRLKTTGRLDRMRLDLRGKGDTLIPGIVTGICLPHTPKSLHLTFSRLREALQSVTEVEAERDAKRAFVDLIKERLDRSSRTGEELNLTLLDLSASTIAKARPSTVTAFLTTVQDQLRHWSVNADSVGLLEDHKFGIVHDQSISSSDLQKHIDAIARKFDPTDSGVTMHTATLAMEGGSLTTDDVSKALVYIINKFVDEGGETFAIQSLSDGCEAAMQETLARVNSFRAIINSDRFVFVFQPIVDLNSGAVHHFEAFARVAQGERHFLPSQFITFAEDVGVVNELDRVAIRRVFQVLKDNKVVNPKANIAVNLSGLSLATPAFTDDLMRVLAENKAMLPRLLIEITETAEMKNLEEANRLLQRVRKMGCRVSLDDFGSGHSAFQILRALEVDFVKIDGNFVTDAMDTRHGKPFLRAIAQLCSDIGIETIGERVEDTGAIDLLREVAVSYGQGYYFAKPMANIVDFTPTLAVPPRRAAG